MIVNHRKRCFKNKKPCRTLVLQGFCGGSWWIRTTEALSSRFTVCPHWPLGKAPIFCFAHPAPECLIIIANQMRKCKPFFEFFSKKFFSNKITRYGFLFEVFGALVCLGCLYLQFAIKSAIITALLYFHASLVKWI